MVRLIFDKYVNEGFGPQRIATWLNDQGYRARTGKMWYHATIRGILGNLTYTGVLRCGVVRSDLIPELQIISEAQYETAQQIRAARSRKSDQEERTVPINTRGQSLLAGNVFCAHCGARLSLTTNGKYRRKADGTMDMTPRIRYICYGKTRKQTECDGPTGYTMHILDGIIDKIVRRIFAQVQGVPKSELISARYKEELAARKSLLQEARTEYNKTAKELAALKAEVVKYIQGESSFSQEMLADLIESTEKKCAEKQTICEKAEAEVQDTEAMLKQPGDQYDEIISFAELYDSASIEAKKMIVNCLIKRVEVGRGYKLNIEFNLHIQPVPGLSGPWFRCVRCIQTPKDLGVCDRHLWVRVYFSAKKKTCLISETGRFPSVLLAFLVEISGIEPLTS